MTSQTHRRTSQALRFCGHAGSKNDLLDGGRAKQIFWTSPCGDQGQAWLGREGRYLRLWLVTETFLCTSTQRPGALTSRGNRMRRSWHPVRPPPRRGVLCRSIWTKAGPRWVQESLGGGITCLGWPCNTSVPPPSIPSEELDIVSCVKVARNVLLNLLPSQSGFLEVGF